MGVPRENGGRWGRRYGAADARDFAAACSDQADRLYADVHVRTLTGEEATAAAVREGMAWLRDESARRLTQLRALDDIDQLIVAAQRFIDQSGRPPRSWEELVDARLLARLPVDPTGWPYVLDDVSGTINVSSESELFPLPGETLPTQ